MLCCGVVCSCGMTISYNGTRPTLAASASFAFCRTKSGNRTLSSSTSKERYSVHGRRKRGYAGDLTHPTIYVGEILICIYVYPPRKKPIPSHANCMQHVLRCWERQSDGSEYKKTLQRPGLRPGPR